MTDQPLLSSRKKAPSVKGNGVGSATAGMDAFSQRRTEGDMTTRPA
ncbi:hypothetical protein [Spirosoma flavum]|uniref:Uncharacterized protein n=1 Tax=Spirosoma flavum TaxID=2048557 RepID=A0ABW6AJE6_9BACT